MNAKKLVKATNIVGMVAVVLLVYWVFVLISSNVFGLKVFREYITEIFLMSILGILAVMGGVQAAKVLLQIETATLKRKGETLSPEREQELLENIQKKYDEQTSPYYAAAHLWVDAIIDPLDTRQWISMGIEAANGAPLKKAFNMGVLQV